MSQRPPASQPEVDDPERAPEYDPPGPGTDTEPDEEEQEEGA